MKFKQYINELVSLTKKQWSDFDLKSLDSETLEYLFSIYKITYQQEKMDLSAYSGKEFVQKYNAVFLIDIDTDPYPDAFIIYKKTKFGNKIALLGSDGEHDSKKELLKEVFKKLKSNGWYIEASKKMEKILSKSDIPFVSDEEKIKKIIPKEINYLENGYYERQLSKVPVKIIKRIYGKPKV